MCFWHSSICSSVAVPNKKELISRSHLSSLWEPGALGCGWLTSVSMEFNLAAQMSRLALSVGCILCNLCNKIRTLWSLLINLGSACGASRVTKTVHLAILTSVSIPPVTNNPSATTSHLARLHSV